MILLAHILFGAAIGSLVKNIPLAIVLAFLSHYLLDLLPHIDYPIKNIEKKQWRKALPDILKLALDFCSGIFLILIFSKNQPIIYICALLAILPDGFTALNYLVPNKISKIHNKLHQKIHFLRYNPPSHRASEGQIKISIFWRVASQVAVVIISIILLKI